LEITAFEPGEQIVLWTTATNGYTPYALYSTNLMSGNPWSDITNETWSISNGAFRVTFPALTNNPVYFYRITATN